MSNDKPIQAHKDLDKTKMIELYQQGLSYDKIAKLMDCSKSTVYYHLHELFLDKDISKEFSRNRANILTEYQRILLNSLTIEEIKKMSPGSRLTCFGILFDKERLERGQSTENCNVQLAPVQLKKPKDAGK